LEVRIVKELEEVKEAKEVKENARAAQWKAGEEEVNSSKLKVEKDGGGTKRPGCRGG